MSKNTMKILTGLRTLADRPYEIVSGKVVAGSVDEGAGTVTILPTDAEEPIEGVLLKAITTMGNGVLQLPKDNSDVIIGSVDGPGEWVVLKISDPEQVVITIDTMECRITADEVMVAHSGIVFRIGDGVFKMSTPSESLYALLNDLITALTSLTVGTSTGPSTVPINVASFSALLTRLSNLTSA
jgi:hypothetical protein